MVLGSPRAGVTGDYEPPDVSAEYWPLQEQCTHLTKSSPSPSYKVVLDVLYGRSSYDTVSPSLHSSFSSRFWVDEQLGE